MLYYIVNCSSLYNYQNIYCCLLSVFLALTILSSLTLTWQIWSVRLTGSPSYLFLLRECVCNYIMYVVQHFHLVLQSASEQFNQTDGAIQMRYYQQKGSCACAVRFLLWRATVVMLPQCSESRLILKSFILSLARSHAPSRLSLREYRQRGY